MGGCIPDSPSKNSKSKRQIHNPIHKIIDNNSIEALRQKWNLVQLKTMQQKMLSLPNPTRFQDFCELFPQVKDFQQRTQRKIYQLFAYQGNGTLSRDEIVNTLTLIRKVNHHDHFAPFLFYVYSTGPRHQYMIPGELLLFQRENERFLRNIPLNGTYQVDSNELDVNQEVVQDCRRTQEVRKQQEPPMSLVQSRNEQQGSSAVNRSRISRQKQKLVSLADFKQQFKKYNLQAYQNIFSWDPKEEQKELIDIIKRQGMKCKTNDQVYLINYGWWLTWTVYIKKYYNQTIQFSSNQNTQNYQSAKNTNNRRLSLKSDSNIKIDSSILKPQQIKNGMLLKQGRNRTELMPNLVQFDNYIVLPQKIWNRLVAIYHGGPPIQRTYPKIYNSLIVKAMLTQDAKFYYKTRKHSKVDNFNVRNLAEKRESKYPIYYKYPGKTNWTLVPQDHKAQDQIFSSQKTFIVFVPPELEEQFKTNYNIQKTNKGRFIKFRFKNFGVQVNISIDGMLTKAEVTDILKSDTIRVNYIDQNGNSHQATVVIDQRLIALNPSNLDNEKKLNQLAGLSNLGNTCYMNAVLQCLIRTPYFGTYLQKEDFKKEKKEKNKEGDNQLLLQELSRLENDARNSHTLDIISTRHFKTVMDKCCPFFEGNLQHDAQQFLICLLTRLSEEIKSKTQYGSTSRKDQKKQQEVNKKIVKFFSGKTEGITQCMRCSNKNTRVEPFFTYSISLPELKQNQYHYYIIQNPRTATCTIPVRYGVTLDRKVTVQDFLHQIAKIHKKQVEHLVFYTIFNNQILNKLEVHSLQEIAHHLNFNVKLVIYEIQHNSEPSYHSFQRRQFRNKSIKLQLRQRIYSAKTHDYRITYLPHIIQITDTMKWDDMISQIRLILAKLQSNKQNQILNQSGSHITKSKPKLSNSDIRVTLDNKDNRDAKLQQKHQKMLGKQQYKIRIVKIDHHYENYCFFCKNEFKVSRRNKCTGDKCHFKKNTFLFQDQEFRNYHDNIVVAVDWQDSLPSQNPQFYDHQSYNQAMIKTNNRKDQLQQLMINSFKNKQILELRCEKQNCLYELAERMESIAVPPNILLLHLKRFRYEDNRLVKLTNHVVYPQQLTLPGTNQVYQLYAVVVHLGSGVGGHYISYVKINNKWFNCDDSKVTLAQPGDEIDTNAYLLCYNKIDFEPSLICLSF